MSNDNRPREDVIRERKYVADYLASACDHFKDMGVAREQIAEAMLTELFKTLDSNPFRTGVDEALLTADQGFLWGLKHRVLPMSEQWDRGWMRVQREKRETQKKPHHFNSAASLPGPLRLVGQVRRSAPPADYNPAQHKMDLILLKLRPGHAYSENQVLRRFAHKVERAHQNRYVDGVDRVQYLTDAKDRVVGWIRRSESAITGQGQA